MSLEVPAHSNHAGKPASRIRQKNEQAILQAAEDEFARHGYKGTSMNTWEDERIAVAVNKIGRDRIVLAGLWTSVCIVGSRSTGA